MIKTARKVVSLVLLITLITTLLPPAQPAKAAAPTGVDGRILTTSQTGDTVNWVEIARSGNYSLIVRSSFLNIYPQAQHYNDPKWQYLTWNDNDGTNYLKTQVYTKINEWFNGTAVAAGDNLPSGARLRKFTVENDVRNYLGTASTSEGLTNGFSSPKTTKRGTGNDIAFALSFSESANFVSKYNFVRGRNPTTQESSAIAKANWEKISMQEPDYKSGEQARGAWLRSPGDINRTMGALSIEPDNRGRAFQMFYNQYERNEYGYLYPALWVDQAIFEPDAPPQYTLSYNANGGSGAPGNQVGNSNTNLTVSSTTPVRSGYSFLGWSTSPTSTYPQYYGGSQIYMNANITLYAVWSPITYTLSYNANGGSGAPASQTVGANSYLTVSSTVPARQGYIFTGWSTNAGASSAQYYAGNQIYMNSDKTLYAVWTAQTYTITYNANGGTGAPSAQTVNAGAATLSNTRPTRSGYTFLGWATTQTATAAQYQAGGQINITGNVTLYAVWSEIIYRITYNANGGTGAPGVQSVAPGNAFLSSVVPTRADHTFLGWATSKTATIAQFSAGGEVTINSDVTLYAVWTQNSYTITYNANGGAGAPPPQEVSSGNAMLSSIIPTRNGYTFIGWSDIQTATTAKYSAGGQITITGNITLYAVWSQRATITITYNANGGTGAPAAQTAYPGEPVILSSVIPTRAGYAFAGWDDNQTAVYSSYMQSGEYVFTRNTILYAVWSEKTTHILIYDANGGSFAPPQRIDQGTKTFKLDEDPAVREGFTFLGWARAADAEVPFSNGYGTWNYPIGSGPYDWEFTTRTGVNGSIFITTIYAVWNKAYIVVFHKDKGTGEILREDKYEVPAGHYGGFLADTFDGYGQGLLAADSAQPSGTIEKFATKTITYLYPRLLIDTANNEAVLTKTGVNLTHTDGKIHVGDRIRYTITAENKGHPITVWANATLTDTMRDGVEFEGNVTLDGKPLVNPIDYTFASGTLVISLGNIKGGESKVVTFEVTVKDDAYGKDIKNSATVIGKNGENGEGFVIETEEDGDDYKVVEQSDKPEIDKITVGDTTVSGKGEPGATIIVEFKNGSTAQTEVEDDGTWIVDIPDDAQPIVKDQKVTATQTQEGKETSEKAEVEVQDRPKAVGDMKKTSTNLSGTGETRVGDTLEYTITLVNIGEAKSLWQIGSITDTLPIEVDYIDGSLRINSNALPAGTEPYDAATRTLTISNLQGILGGESITVTFEATINEKAYENGFKNTAEVDGEPVEEDGGPITVVPRSKQPTIDEVNAGDNEITGTGEPGSVIEITFPGTDDKYYGCVGEDGTWTVGVPGSVKQLKEGDVINAVQIEDGLDPSLPTEATVQAKKPVVPYITKTSRNLTTQEGKARVNDKIKYTITVGNSGSPKSIWTNVIVTDVIPTGLTLDESSIRIDRETTQNASYDENTKTLEVRIPDGIRGGQEVEITFTARVNEDAYDLTDPIVNSVSAEGNENGDPNKPIDIDTEEEDGGHTVAGKSDKPTIDDITEGDKEITGTGIIGAIIIVTLPDGTMLETTVGNDGTWTVELPDGKEAEYDNEFTAEQIDGDKDPSDPVRMDVLPRPDAECKATKTAENLSGPNETRKVGDTLRYTITVKNNGNPKSLWKGVVVEDKLPEEVDFLPDSVEIDGTAAGTAAQYDEETHTLTVDLGNIPGGVEIKVTFEVEINDKAYGKTFTNTAIVDEETAEEEDAPVVKRRSYKPEINEILERDKVVTGTGVPGAQIEVSFKNGVIVTTTVDENGAWIVNVPAGTNLAEGDTVTAVQTEEGYDPSIPAVATVKEKPYRTVHGFVWPIVTDDFGYGEDFVKKHNIIVELRATFNTEAEPGLSTIATITINSENDDIGEFTIENVPFGTYVLYISRPGYLVRTMIVTISKDEPDIFELKPPAEDPESITVFTLWWGDCNGDGRVDGRDTAMITELLNKDKNSSEYEPACDLNADGRIDGRDSALITANINKNAKQYAGAGEVNFGT